MVIENLDTTQPPLNPPLRLPPQGSLIGYEGVVPPTTPSRGRTTDYPFTGPSHRLPLIRPSYQLLPHGTVAPATPSRGRSTDHPFTGPSHQLPLHRAVIPTAPSRDHCTHYPLTGTLHRLPLHRDVTPTFPVHRRYEAHPEASPQSHTVTRHDGTSGTTQLVQTAHAYHTSTT